MQSTLLCLCSIWPNKYLGGGTRTLYKFLNFTHVYIRFCGYILSLHVWVNFIVHCNLPNKNLKEYCQEQGMQVHKSPDLHCFALDQSVSFPTLSAHSVHWWAYPASPIPFKCHRKEQPIISTQDLLRVPYAVKQKKCLGCNCIQWS